MRIGFYAPMKAPDHPVPSGDRQMARLLIAGLGLAGHRVDLLSRVRSFLPRPDPVRASAVAQEAAAEVDRLAGAWADPAFRPDLVFAYHLHYKAPDLVGLPLARRFGLPYATAEASYARKRDAPPWGERQALVVEAVRSAAVNLCFTANDRLGLAEIVAGERLMDLPPFIDAARFAANPARSSTGHDLVTVAMMRPGDKLASYSFLADALARLTAIDWRLTVVGDGPARSAVEAALAKLPRSRLRLLGALPAEAVERELQGADLFVWPGFNEAFGLCYLEAAATGLPAVAVHGEGTPSVILHEETGLLTRPDPALYAAALVQLLADAALRARYGRAASRFVRGERDIGAAAVQLGMAVRRAMTTTGAATHVG